MPTLPGWTGRELLFLPGQRVVDAQGHGDSFFTRALDAAATPVDQHHHLAAHRLGPADVADALAGLGLDVDGVRRQPEQPGEVGADRRLDGPELRLLGEDDHIHD